MHLTTSVTLKMKMVRLDDDVHRRLTELGKYGESLSDIVQRVLDELEECKNAKGKK
jgi:predicted CopG family antitoxin